jgi:HAD superfamily hydrolase (TIGR01509 family)
LEIILEERCDGCLGAVLWDMDGVLVDSIDLHYLSWAKALASFDISLSRQKYLQYFGRSSADVAAGVINPEVSASLKSEIRHRKDIFFEDLVPHLARQMPGAYDWVRRFSTCLPQAVATSSTYHQTILILNHLGLGRYFQTVVTSSDLPGKPDPTVFLTAARQLGIEPANCLVIEDSPSGVEASKRAGMLVIAVCTTNPAQALTAADLVIPNLLQLKVAHLQQLFPLIPEMNSLFAD